MLGFRPFLVTALAAFASIVPSAGNPLAPRQSIDPGIGAIKGLETLASIFTDCALLIPDAPTNASIADVVQAKLQSIVDGNDGAQGQPAPTGPYPEVQQYAVLASQSDATLTLKVFLYELAKYKSVFLPRIDFFKLYFSNTANAIAAFGERAVTTIPKVLEVSRANDAVQSAALNATVAAFGV